MILQLLISFLLVGTTVAFGGGKGLVDLSFEQISEFRISNRMGRKDPMNESHMLTETTVRWSHFQMPGTCTWSISIIFFHCSALLRVTNKECQ